MDEFMALYVIIATVGIVVLLVALLSVKSAQDSKRKRESNSDKLASIVMRSGAITGWVVLFIIGVVVWKVITFIGANVK